MFRLGLLLVICGGWLGTAGIDAAVASGDTMPKTLPTNLWPGEPKARKVYVTWRDAPLRQRPDASSPVLETAPFLGEFYVAGVDRGRNHYLLATADPIRGLILKVHGWIDSRQCLTFASDHWPECLRDQRTQIFRKAMLINRIRPEEGVESLNRPVALVDRPEQGGRERSRRSLFEIYYIYDHTDGYLLLGREPLIKSSARRHVTLLGWVPKDRACLWNTREAIEFNKDDIDLRHRPCRIFQDRESLIAYLEYAPDVPCLAVEDLRVKRWEHYQARFPLVDDEDAALQGQAHKRYRVYKIGVIGDVWIPDGRALRAQRIAELRQQVRELREEASKIQIMFVIDATWSMERWFPSVREAINQIVQGVNQWRQAAEIEAREPTISVNFYRDRGEGRAMFKANAFGNVAAALSLLEKEKPLGGGAPYEMVFEAVCRSLQANPFDPHAIKILILIGDDGNDPNDSKFALDDVCQALIAASGSSPIGFHAFVVGEGAHRKAFQQQAQRIAERLVQQEKERFGQQKEPLPKQVERALRQLVGQVVVTREPDRLVSAIRRRFDLAVLQMEWLRDRLDRLETGETIEQERSATRLADSSLDEQTLHAYGVVWQQQMHDLVRRQGWEPLEMARHGVQLFTKGWIADRDPYETRQAGSEPVLQIRHVWFLHRSELRRLSVLLDTILRKWDDRAIDRTWKLALDEVTGGDVQIRPNARPADLLQMYLGIKAREGILALPLNQISQTPVDRAALRQTLQRKYDQIEDVLQEKAFDYVPRSELMRLVDLLATILENQDDTASIQTWQAALASVTREDVAVRPDASAASLMKRYMGVRTSEPILALPLTVVRRSPDNCDALVEALQRKYDQIKDALSEHMRYAGLPDPAMSVGNAAATLLRIEVGPRPYFWGDERRGDDLRAWVDRDYLP